MGNVTYGFMSGYNSVGKYSRLFVLLLLALGVFTSFASAIACTYKYNDLIAGGPSGGTCASNPTCDIAGCGALTSIGCASGKQQCISPANAVMFPLCGVYNNVHNIIFLLAIVLVIMGGALYAGANIMPSASKGAIQGYGMGFILGGVVGVIISILAPYIIGIVSGQSSTSILSVCNS